MLKPYARLPAHRAVGELRERRPRRGLERDARGAPHRGRALLGLPGDQDLLN